MKRIVGLIVTGFILWLKPSAVGLFQRGKARNQTHQGTKVVPNLGNIRVEADGTGVRIKCITILVDLIVKNANGAPKCWIPPVPIDCLLVGFVRFRELLLCHVASAKQIPTLRIFVVWNVVSRKQGCEIERVRTRADRLFEVFDRLFLALEAVALLVMQPAQLLQDLCMFRVALQDMAVCMLGTFILDLQVVSIKPCWGRIPSQHHTYVLLLFVYMANLEPDIFLIQRSRRIANNIPEALNHARQRSPFSRKAVRADVPQDFAETLPAACK